MLLVYRFTPRLLTVISRSYTELSGMRILAPHSHRTSQTSESSSRFSDTILTGWMTWCAVNGATQGVLDWIEPGPDMIPT